MHHHWYAWVVIGFIAGSLAGRVTKVKAGGCLTTTLVGIIGGLIGGYVFDRQDDQVTYGILASILIAFLFSVIFLLILKALGLARPARPWDNLGRRRRRWL